ncbi:MAG: CPBP family intramembrane metalloprotease [Planctomycetes bacterium]|nr:CPBP family intramembrane metalloprotease [Planctomycetota bacterium]
MQPDFDEPEGAFFDQEIWSPTPAKRKGWTLTAWFVIVVLLVGFVALQNMADESPQTKPQQERLELIVFEMQARYIVGTEAVFHAGKEDQLKQAESLDKGGLPQRLRFAILAGELGGPKDALVALDQLPDDDESIRAILIRLYGDYEQERWKAPSVSQAERDWLRDRLGWFGELALNPATQQSAAREQVTAKANWTFLTFVVGLGVAIVVGFAGFVGLVVFLALLCSRKLQGGIVTGSGNGGIYAETFALWLALFILLQIFLPLLPWRASMLVKGAVLSVGSLAALAWPVARGIPWSQVVRDIGWTAGRSPALEPWIGVSCYVMSMPIIAIGLLLTLLLASLRQGILAGFGQQDVPIHPIVELLADGDAWTRAQMAILACIIAPIVEETMFRGVLYRHIRELTRHWAWLVSVVASSTVVSFFFAAIHPQGFVAIPALMSIAYGLTIAREWRGSLVPCMVGHALNNGLLVLFVILVLGG